MTQTEKLPRGPRKPLTEDDLRKLAPSGYFDRPKTYRIDKRSNIRGGHLLSQFRGTELVYQVWCGSDYILELERQTTEGRGFSKQEGSL